MAADNPTNTSGVKPSRRYIKHDLTGSRFTRLVALRPAWPKDRLSWECICDCGTSCVIEAYKLRTGWTQSCGCLRDERTRRANTTHGESKGYRRSSELGTYRAMLERCYDPNNKRYPIYGARGITVCDKWRNSFEAFLADVGRRPTPAHSLDRIETNGNYEPGNVRWATDKAQQRNRRNNYLITYRDTTATLMEWSERTGMGWATLRYRINAGWAVERAFTQPVRKSGR